MSECFKNNPMLTSGLRIDEDRLYFYVAFINLKFLGAITFIIRVATKFI